MRDGIIFSMRKNEAPYPLFSSCGDRGGFSLLMIYIVNFKHCGIDTCSILGMEPVLGITKRGIRLSFKFHTHKIFSRHQLVICATRVSMTLA